MNLITKTTLLYLLVALLVFGIGGVVTFFIVQEEVQKETDFTLRDNLREMVEEVREGVPLNILRRGNVEIIPLGSQVQVDTQYVFSDTLAPHPYLEGQMEPYRKITAVREIDGQYYRISITDIFIESDDIYDVVVDIMLKLFLILGVSMIIFSFLITHWLFQPFQKILYQISSFNLKKQEKLHLPDTTTREFQQLNTFVSQMASKARRDYLAVKEFSENASHEMQTPLAIARGKLELLLETPGLTNEQLELVNAVQQSIGKLSRLGTALQLLTKIENKEFARQEAVNLSEILNQNLSHFGELASLKGLSLRSENEPNVFITVDPTLADILIGNLLKNAIRHNTDKGWIEVKLDKKHLSIRNTGLPPTVPPEQLFERFQKGPLSNGSLGLGLAIVKKIVDASNFRASYDYGEGVHQVSVIFF